jgi:alpha-tubulin suppressor-like RCC1 family protein
MDWGYNFSGQLGNNSTANSSVPVDVDRTGVLAGRTVTAVVSGGFHSLALCSDGTLVAWGSNFVGQLGNNSATDSHVPVPVDQTGVLSGKRVIAIAVGEYHSLALCSDSTLAAWGSNSYGEIGDGVSLPGHISVPTAVYRGGVLSGKTITAIAAGSYFSMALCSDGTLAAWGNNNAGELGNNSNTDSKSPVAVIRTGVLSGKTIIGIAAGYHHSMALCSDGTLAAWGSNNLGQLGENSYPVAKLVPVAVIQSGVLSGKTPIAIAAGHDHSLALCSDGTLAVWGDNTNGQLGNNSTTQSNVPAAVLQSGVLSGKTVTSIAAGVSHSLALCSDGTLATWGDNTNGQLGNNSTTQSNVAVTVLTSMLAAGERWIIGNTNLGARHNLALVASPPPPPTAVTTAATSLTTTGATVNGTVNANSYSAAVSFDYGTSTSYGSNVAGTPTPVTGSSTTPVSATLTGLTPGTTYHFRVNGASIVGTGNGNDLTFATISNNANLSNLVLSSGTLAPVFASGTTSYTASVPNATASVTVTPTKADATATVTVNGGSPANPVALNVGANPVTVLVTAQDGTPKTYTVTVTRLSNNADLSNLTLSSGTLAPAFASGTSYTASVPNAIASVTVTPTVADGTATVTVNGGSPATPVALGIGVNTIPVLVTAQDGTPKTYTVAVTRQNSLGPISGTRTVGPAGNYVSISAAIADVQAAGNGLGGALVLELLPAYVSTVETFPITIPTLNGASAANTLTIRPASGATALAVTSADTTAATVDLNGAQFVTIDGRAGGTGTVSQLTIANTSASGVALRFINEASGNNVQYLTLQGMNASATGGTVVFSTTTGANGNDNNTIDHCDIRDGASTPANGLYALGTTATPAQNNSGNTVSNCNVFNFYASTAVDSAGVRLDGGNTDWAITGNSFYQTASRAGVAANVRGIHLNNVSGNNFTVTGNFIGGSAPNAGGTAWTTTGTTQAYLFQGIRLNVGATTPSSVQGNPVRNIVWTTSSFSSSVPGIWSGIFAQAGAVNIGTTAGNIIGSGTGTGSISVTTSASGGTTFGINSSSSGAVTVANNLIGSITTNNPGSTIAAPLIGIQSSGTATVSGNAVGSTVTANSLNAAAPAFTQQVVGILSPGTGSATISGNTVANLNNSTVGSFPTDHVWGIAATDGVNTITGNTIRNLSTTSQSTGTALGTSLCGILVQSSLGGQTVSQNTVHSLSNTATTGGVIGAGIYFDGVTGSHVISRNLVHGISLAPGGGGTLKGMEISGGATVQNNMVRVGIDASGVSTAGASAIFGIRDRSSGVRKYYHNSVWVGGTQTSGSANSFALQGTTADFRNNIFVNVRTNSGGTGRHYAVTYAGTVPNPAGLTASNNIFLASGTGGVLGLYNSVDRTTLAAWQSATGVDAASAVGDPIFVNPTGDAASVNLHLQASNPAEGQGVSIAGVTDDFDGQTRSTLTPVDIGADAGNFTISPDLFAPVISYPLLTSGSTANRVLAGWATITDAVGVATGANAPRLYFKKSTDADAFGVANDSLGNGWKYVTATGSGPYSFTLDYTLINGGSVTAGDTIQYFVVAQDAANNFVSSTAGATASANPPVQNVNGHGAVNSFSVVPTISGTKAVGGGGDYPSLSGAGGLFAAINAGVLTGNVVVNVTGNVTETGGVILNQWLEEGAGNYTLTIQPDSTTMRTISGSVNAGLITLSGADRVTIDGRFGGTGRYLTFRNTNTGSSASTIRLVNDASNNTVRSCIVEGAGTASGVISFGTGTVTGNDSNVILACQVRDRSDAAGVPAVLVASTGSSDTVANSGNTISNSELFNFNSTGIFISATGNDSWTLAGNNIYEVNAAASTPNGPAGIEMDGGGTNGIAGNYIHDLLTASTASKGIVIGALGTTTIARNRITALNVNAATTAVFGIYAVSSAVSTLHVVNNQITLSPAASGATTLVGLYDFGSVGGVVNVFSNSIVLGGTESGTFTSWTSLRRVASTHTARDNLFLNLRTGGTGSHFAAGSEVTGGSYTVSHNVYAGTGATAANFMDFNTTTSPFAMSFAAWQSSTGDTNSQAGIAGSGNFTSAMFVSAATGDLHLVPGGNVLVNATGTPIAGVTDDYDGDPRSATAPMIGADEILLPDIAVAQGTALADGGSVDFGNVAPGSSSAKTFTITNPGAADLAGLAVSGGTGEFSVGALSGPAVPVGGGSVTFTVTFTPNASGAGGARSAALHIASNVTGTKNPFDIALTGTTQTAFQAWAATNGAANDPNALGANGQKNVVNFAFGMNPATGDAGALVFNGMLAAGGTIGATGLPVTWMDGADCRALFIVRKDAAAAGLTYTPQFSADLTTGWQTSAAPPTVLADDGTYQILGVPYPALMATQGTGFFHVQVSLAP